MRWRAATRSINGRFDRGHQRPLALIPQRHCLLGKAKPDGGTLQALSRLTGYYEINTSVGAGSATKSYVSQPGGAKSEKTRSSSRKWCCARDNEAV